MAFVADLRASVVGENSKHPSGANLFGTLAHSPALTMAYLAFNGHLLNRSTLPARWRELLILRVAHVRRCDYEWAQHVPLADSLGYSSAEIGRIAEGPAAAGWSPVERALLTAADELIADGTVGEQAWKVLAEELDVRQLLDVVFVVGTYGMLAMAMRAFGVEPDDDLVPYLPR
jgi:AhpD family alkylhydroperoxidase